MISNTTDLLNRVKLIAIFALLVQIKLAGQAGSKGLVIQSDVIRNCEIKLKVYPILLSSVEAHIGDSSVVSYLQIRDGWMLLDSSFCIQNRGKSLKVSYRSFPIDFNKRYSLIDSSQLKKKETAIYIGYDLNPYEQAGRPIIDKGIDYSGSFARGFSLGNSQSLVLNSNFNLQLNGDLGNGMKIAAAISDDNIPIQPEGNTQVLQEFDRVYIEISKDKTSVIAGDYELRRPDSYFMNYFKKLKGIGVRNESWAGDQVITTSANIASSRGKFARQNLVTREGNQGPYRLQGNNNERYIIVLSGTEKIFLDGRLLRRGLEFDYIIDYNTAELTFSPSVLIKNESRVIVEYEYTDLNYFRTLYSANTSVQGKSMKFGFNFYSEQDSKNSTSQIELGPTDIELLESIGDNTAFRSGVTAFDTTSSQPGYLLMDNPNYPNDPNPKILVFTSDKNKVEVSATFTEVGSGKGSYAINSNAGVNARVYQYAGYLMGSYDPIITLVPPEQRQMMALEGKWKINPFAEISGELSLSNNDRNRFSNLNDTDNKGLAGVIRYDFQKPISRDSSLFISNFASLEITGMHFLPLNPYRNAEFLRDWNLPSNFIKKEGERVVYSGIRLSKNKTGSINYLFSNYSIRDFLSGFKNQIVGEYQKNGLELRTNSSISTISIEGKESSFIRPNLEASKKINVYNGLRVGITYDGEDNKFKSVNGDSLLSNSYGFDYYKFFISSDTGSQMSYRLSYNKRKDRRSDGYIYRDIISINELEFGSAWTGSSLQTLSTNIKYRNFEVLNASLVPNEKTKSTILGMIDHQISLLNKGLSLGTNYIINSGQEPRIEYAYTKVENNQGDYVFIGEDTSSIKTYNDFRYDPTNPLASYIRVSLPNNEFIRTNNISLNEIIRIEPKKFFRRDSLPQSKIKMFLEKWGANITLRLTNKELDNGAENINLINFSTADSSLVSYSSLQNYNVYFNRGNPRYDLNFFNRRNSNKQNLINGIEERKLNENELRLRWNIFNNTDFILSGTDGRRAYENLIFSSRNLDIKYSKINPEIEYRPSTKARYSVKYTYENRKQQIQKEEAAIIQNLTTGINLRKASTSAIDLNLSFVKINFTGVNSAIEYDILDGLRDGNNYLWNASYTKRFSGNIDLNISYEGRKTGDAPTVHVMRAQVKASF